MNKALRYTSRAQTPGHPAHIARIRLHPFANDDFITIGLAAENITGERFLRYLDARALERVQCLLDTPLDIDWMLRQLAANKTAWSSLDELDQSLSSFALTLSIPEPHHMPIDQQRFERLFDSLVSLKEKATESRPFLPKGRDEVRSAVFTAIRKRLDIAAERFIQEAPLKLADGQPPLEIDLLDERHAGAIVSAWYATTDRIETNFLRGYMDVECASRVRTLNGGLFLLRPSEYPGIEASRIEKIDDLLDRLAWKADRSGMTVRIETETDALTNDILEWIGQPL